MDMEFAQAIREAFCPLCPSRENFASQHWRTAMGEAESICCRYSLNHGVFILLGQAYRSGWRDTGSKVWQEMRKFLDGTEGTTHERIYVLPKKAMPFIQAARRLGWKE